MSSVRARMGLCDKGPAKTKDDFPSLRIRSVSNWVGARQSDYLVHFIRLKMD